MTGWIPERIAIRTKEPFNPEANFDRLESALHNGRCLITVATGDLTDAEAERTGLVSSHAYAVLDLRDVNVNIPLSFETFNFHVIKRFCFHQ